MASGGGVKGGTRAKAKVAARTHAAPRGAFGRVLGAGHGDANYLVRGSRQRRSRPNLEVGLTVQVGGLDAAHARGVTGLHNDDVRGALLALAQLDNVPNLGHGGRGLLLWWWWCRGRGRGRREVAMEKLPCQQPSMVGV
jgi:hypothetical protein